MDKIIKINYYEMFKHYLTLSYLSLNARNNFKDFNCHTIFEYRQLNVWQQKHFLRKQIIPSDKVNFKFDILENRLHVIHGLRDY